MIAPSCGAGNSLRLGTAFRIFLAITALALASCATNRLSSATKLVGKWRSSLGRQTAEYAFANDGSFTGQVRARGALVSDFAGQWSIRGDTLLYRYTSDRLNSIPPGTLDRDQLLAVEKDHYLIQARDGSRRKYVRVAP